jgi:aspartate/methionine/tyrosine aminotransferase
MNPLAEQLNREIETHGPAVSQMLSRVGRQLFFPKGILSQGAEAKEKAHRINATIGIAKEAGRTMVLDSVMESLSGVRPSESLTYAPSFGIPALRKLWREELREKNPSLSEQPLSLPVVTCGITHAVSVFADLWVDPGDVILVPDKFWGNYNMIFQVRKGADLQHYPLFTEDYRLNLDGFEETVRLTAAETGKIVVLLNFPQNPTGYTATREEGERIAEILENAAQKGANVIAVCDDAYFGLFYEEDTLKESMFSLLCDRHPRLLAVKLDGATKENYVWGFRVGFITYGCQCGGDPDALYGALEKKTAGCVRGNISNAPHISQTLLLKSMQSPAYSKEREEKFQILKSRAQKVKAVLSNAKYDSAWDVYPFNSGYFMCLKLKTVDAEKLRVHLLDNYGVGLISLGATDLRVAFSCIEESDVESLFDTIFQGVGELEQAG